MGYACVFAHACMYWMCELNLAKPWRVSTRLAAPTAAGSAAAAAACCVSGACLSQQQTRMSDISLQNSLWRKSMSAKEMVRSFDPRRLRCICFSDRCSLTRKSKGNCLHSCQGVLLSLSLHPHNRCSHLATGRSTGEAYVVLETPVQAEQALAQLNKKYMGSRYIE